VKIFSVEHNSAEVFILDTPEIRRVACHPSVVGEELERLMLQNARKTLPAILELASVQPSDSMLFEQILRAAPGYELHRAAEGQLPGAFRIAYIRPRYVRASYRDHDGVAQQKLEVVYEDFSQVQKNRKTVLIMQDTVASSRSAAVSLETAIKYCNQAGSEIVKWVVYGFVSARGLELLAQLAKNHKIPLYVFALGNLTAMSANNYDMPLFGVDEWQWQQNGTVRKIGGLVDKSTFLRYLPEFIPGADQPGDWSARQHRLYTGTGYEQGDINVHLEHSMRLIQNLIKTGTLQDWQRQTADEEISRIKQLLDGTNTG
jgi:hypothetical protein